MSKSVIYTAIFGDYDDLNDPQIADPDYDYVCFTDNRKLKSDIWDVRIIDLPVANDYPRSNRCVKINAYKFFPGHEESLYIDGNIILNKIPNFAEMLADYKFAVEKHPRDVCCVYEEAEQCKALGFGVASELDEQVRDYRKAGFPQHAGLWANGIMFRKHHEPHLVELTKTWWEHVMKYSWRDQISFPYAFRTYPINTLPLYYLACQGIIGYKEHLRKV